MSTTSDLYDGFGTLLTTAGVGIWHADPAEGFADSDTAIVEEELLTSPDRAIALVAIPLIQNPVLPSGRYLLQVQTRGRPYEARDTADLDGAVFDQIQNLTGVAFGSTRVVQVLFYTSVTLGPDESMRYVRSTKYWVDVDVAPTSLRPDGGAWD